MAKSKKKRGPKCVWLTKAYVDSLKSELQHLKAKNTELNNDREKHRNYFLKLLRDVIKIHGGGQAVNTTWLIEDLAKHFNSVERWWW